MIEVNNRTLDHILLWCLAIFSMIASYIDFKWFQDLTICIFCIPIGIIALWKALTFNWNISISRKI